MDRPGVVAERATLAASEHGLDLAENGKGDFLAASALIDPIRVD